MRLRRRREEQVAAPPPRPRPRIDGGAVPRSGWQGLAPRHEPSAPRPPAPVALLATEFRSRAFGSSGERIMAARGEDPPPPPPQQPFVIEPWPEYERREAIQNAPESEPAAPTILEVMAADSPESPFPGPPQKLEPLLPPAVPPADWRLEEEERAVQSKPTPHLDRAREILKEVKR
jgi:hypothetical protein